MAFFLYTIWSPEQYPQNNDNINIIVSPFNNCVLTAWSGILLIAYSQQRNDFISQMEVTSNRRKEIYVLWTRNYNNAR